MSELNFELSNSDLNSDSERLQEGVDFHLDNHIALTKEAQLKPDLARRARSLISKIGTKKQPRASRSQGDQDSFSVPVQEDHLEVRSTAGKNRRKNKNKKPKRMTDPEASTSGPSVIASLPNSACPTCNQDPCTCGEGEATEEPTSGEATTGTDGLIQKVDQLIVTVNAQTNAVSGLYKKVSTYEATQQTILRNIIDLQGNLSSIIGSISNLDAATCSLQNPISAIEISTEYIKQDISGIKEKLVQMEEEIYHLGITRSKIAGKVKGKKSGKKQEREEDDSEAESRADDACSSVAPSSKKQGAKEKEQSKSTIKISAGIPLAPELINKIASRCNTLTEPMVRKLFSFEEASGLRDFLRGFGYKVKDRELEEWFQDLNNRVFSTAYLIDRNLSKNITDASKKATGSRSKDNKCSSRKEKEKQQKSSKKHMSSTEEDSEESEDSTEGSEDEENSDEPDTFVDYRKRAVLGVSKTFGKSRRAN